MLLFCMESRVRSVIQGELNHLLGIRLACFLAAAVSERSAGRGRWCVRRLRERARLSLRVNDMGLFKRHGIGMKWLRGRRILEKPSRSARLLRNKHVIFYQFIAVNLRQTLQFRWNAV